MAIRKYRKKMNGGNILKKFGDGASDIKSGMNTLNEKRKKVQEDAKQSADLAKASYRDTLRSGTLGGNNHIMPSGITGGLPQPPVMNNLSTPSSLAPPPALPPKFGGRRRRRRRRTRKKRRRKRKTRRRKTRRRKTRRRR